MKCIIDIIWLVMVGCWLLPAAVVLVEYIEDHLGRRVLLIWRRRSSEKVGS